MLVERLSAEGLPHEHSGVDYLAECYKRLEQRRPLHKVRCSIGHVYSGAPERHLQNYAEFFTQVNKMIASYVALALAYPDMFNLPYAASCT